MIAGKVKVIYNNNVFYICYSYVNNLIASQLASYKIKDYVTTGKMYVERFSLRQYENIYNTKHIQPSLWYKEIHGGIRTENNIYAQVDPIESQKIK